MSFSKLSTVLLAALSFHGVAAAQQTGEAIVEVEAPAAYGAGSFAFEGTPAGTAAGGGSVAAATLASGRHESRLVVSPPDLQLVDISCDDVLSTTPSTGDTASGIAAFNIDAGETVSCVFVFSAVISQSGSSGTGEPGSGGPGSGGGDVDCDATAIAPVQGPWSVSNHTGRMVCNGPAGSMDMPLKASTEDGTIKVTNCGWTIVGTGMADDTAPLEMHAVDRDSGRYLGEVGGSQDGIPMTIKFDWALRSETWIEGSLSSTVSQQGMTCTMSRSFELRYAGN